MLIAGLQPTHICKIAFRVLGSAMQSVRKVWKWLDLFKINSKETRVGINLLVK